MCSKVDFIYTSGCSTSTNKWGDIYGLYRIQFGAHGLDKCETKCVSI